MVNRLVATTTETDLDGELCDAVGMTLEKDACVDTSRLEIRVRDAVVQLHGRVPRGVESEMAEFDAWYVFGVEDVENRIGLDRPPARTGGRGAGGL